MKRFIRSIKGAWLRSILRWHKWRYKAHVQGERFWEDSLAMLKREYNTDFQAIACCRERAVRHTIEKYRSDEKFAKAAARLAAYNRGE